MKFVRNVNTIKVVDAVCAVRKCSKSEARRLIKNNAVSIDGVKVNTEYFRVEEKTSEEPVLRCGKDIARITNAWHSYKIYD